MTTDEDVAQFHTALKSLPSTVAFLHVLPNPDGLCLNEKAASLPLTPRSMQVGARAEIKVLLLELS